MLQSPLHLLIFLRRILLRTKLRHRACYHPHLLFRPITKPTSWSTAFASKISTTSFGKQQQQQQQQSHRLPSATPSPITRRLLLSRRPHSKSSLLCFQQRRTMVSSGAGGHSANQITTTAMNTTHYFTSQCPLLGVHGGGPLLPAAPGSFRSYSTKQHWAYRQQQHQHQQQQQQQQSSSTDDDTNGIDGISYGNSTNVSLLKKKTHSGSSSSSNTTGSTNANTKQQVYRPPNMRGMADLMDDNRGAYGSTRSSSIGDNSNTSNGNSHSQSNGKHNYPGLVHRGQPPRKTSPLLKRVDSSSATALTPPSTPSSTQLMYIAPVDVLRHDDLSLQTTKKSTTATTTHDDDTSCNPTRQWYISIPMDLPSLLLSEDNNMKQTPSSTFPAPPSMEEGYYYMSRAISVLDSTWLASFQSWSIRLRTHLAKVMMLIQLIGIEAQRYHTNSKKHTPSDTMMDYKMVMTKADACTELCIFLPHQLCAPQPDSTLLLQQWVHRLMKEPPHFEIKWRHMDHHHQEEAGPSAMRQTDDGVASRSHQVASDNEDEGEDDLVIVSGSVNEDDSDKNDTSWRIGPHYFQDIHVFLNHVDSMIDSSPAFTKGTQRRFSL